MVAPVSTGTKRIAACVATALLVACAGSGDPSEPAATAGLDGGAFDPIDGMEASTAQQPISAEDDLVIYSAEQRLIASCMAKRGFEYPVTPPGELVAPAPRYLSPSELRRSGYQYDWKAAADRFLKLNGPDGPPSPTDGMSEAEAKAYDEALGGSTPDATVTLQDPGGGARAASTEGCIAEAQIELYGSVENAMRYDRAGEMLSLVGIRDELLKSAEYRRSLREWQKCMLEHGYNVAEDDYDEIDYGMEYLQSRGMRALVTQGSDQRDVTAEVITSVANADADCQESSGLYDVRSEMLPDVEDAVAAKLGFEMNQYVAFQHAVLERAKRVP